MTECVLCRDQDLLQGAVLAENDLCYLLEVMDMNFTLTIVPERHVLSPFDFTKKEWDAVLSMLKVAKEILESGNPDGFTIGWNIGSAAGQHIPHAHVQIFARFDNDSNAGQGIQHLIKMSHNK